MRDEGPADHLGERDDFLLVELAAENHAVTAVGPRNGFVDVRSGDGKAPGALDRLTILAEIFRVTGVELVDPPRAAPASARSQVRARAALPSPASSFAFATA